MAQFDYIKYGSKTYSVPKLYAGQGAETDGAITQKAATELLFAKADKTALPVKISDLRNDAGYQTETQVQALIDDAVAGISGIEYQIVTELPTTGRKGVIYLVETSATAGDIYDEFIWIDGDPAGHYEKIGTTAADLSDYYTKTEVDAKIAETDEAVATKQDLLVSGTNLKTINGESLLGAGNIYTESRLVDGAVTFDGTITQGYSGNLEIAPSTNGYNFSEFNTYAAHKVTKELVDKTYVDAGLAPKADKSYVDEGLENKIGSTEAQALIDEALEGGGASGYTQVESITTSDGAWIDTGVAGSGLQKIRVRAAVPANKILNVVNHISQSSRMGFMIFNTASHKMAFFWGGVGFTEQVIDANIDLSQPFDVYQDRFGITVSQGSYSTTRSYSGSEDAALASGTLQLLHSGNPSHQTDQYNSGTIFSASIGAEGSDEWTTFEPAVRDEDSTAGLLETTPAGEQTFKTTAAAGTTFTAGAETETGYASKAWVKQYLETLDATGVSY